FLSFDDDLMKIFARDWVKVMMEKMGLKSGEVIDSPMVTRGIARAQRKVEARNFDIRKHLLEYDEVMDKQRKFIYTQRQDCLEMKGMRDKVLGMFEEVLDPVLERYAGDKDTPIDFVEIRKWLVHKAGHELRLDGFEQVEREQLFTWVMQRVEELQDQRAKHYGEDWDKLIQFLLVRTIDEKWKDHLHAMEVLKAGVGLRGYAQIDPKNEYKKEGFEKFELLKDSIADAVTDVVYKVEFKRQEDLLPPPPPKAAMPMPRTPEEVQALFESLVAAGQVPQEIMQRMQQGERFMLRVTPQGLVLQPAAPPQPGAGGAAAAAAPAVQPAANTPSPVAGAADAARAPLASAAAPPVPAASRGTSMAMAPKDGGASRPATARAVAGAAGQRAANAPKAGRNDPCPCGSGVKYKKCCAPAFD
ncbi:MAG TPA: SEC-C metal-binding domain-containing protein, partial [Planctomycetota bacterium]|nr:SEC-C metal-binding domain-containing protein [Planctomycetota bacterium]